MTRVSVVISRQHCIGHANRGFTASWNPPRTYDFWNVRVHISLELLDKEVHGSESWRCETEKEAIEQTRRLQSAIRKTFSSCKVRTKKLETNIDGDESLYPTLKAAMHLD